VVTAGNATAGPARKKTVPDTYALVAAEAPNVNVAAAKAAAAAMKANFFIDCLHQADSTMG
jgi:hypothetical protein